ncbi:hypothetical protein VTP01DRAFT_1184 [Rhizomucor pusillus]|uniref:uncharacterized protein n=1 Tax=Rhizomucor pusillus TaxID=4840 RepID=UPI003743BB85
MPSLRNVLYMAWSVKALVQHTIGQFKAFPSRKRDENDSDDDEYFTKTMEHHQKTNSTCPIPSPHWNNQYVLEQFQVMRSCAYPCIYSVVFTCTVRLLQ